MIGFDDLPADMQAFLRETPIEVPCPIAHMMVRRYGPDAIEALKRVMLEKFGVMA